ncbi:MAG: Eco57I restriction-modification methylase domain-containing protein [Methanobrevibacter sp.]|nr:Eco57I restriction-modification methylase domain-containing protein [Candidatus Methanovirga meridionalis]
MKEQSLFNLSKIKQLMSKHNTELKINNEKREIIHNWNNEFKEGKLKEEKSNYINFSIEILTKLLGYNNKENYVFEEKHDDKHPVEFTLLKNEEPYAVIELKGSDTNLDKRYNNKISAVEQAFNYATKKQSIQWVIVSNYYEFRLYNKSNQEDCIKFNVEELDELNTSKKPVNLQLFLLIFSKWSLLDNNIISNLYKSTILIEQNLESNFYKLFSETRLMIIAELQNNHFEKTKTEIVHYAQSILNRYIFICFAEDLGLLPPETSTETLITPITHKNLFKSTLWDRLNELFMFVNEGNPDKNIESYNGGLFKEDFSNIKIRDFVDDFNIFNDSYHKWDFEKYSKAIEDKIGSNYRDRINPIFKNLLVISSFNFSSELDVNILGHIFENSISELEKIQEEDYSKKTPNNKGRRKKDGIFYTPDNITNYICENTVIPYLSKDKKAITIQDLISQYKENEIDILDEKLKNIKIIDPACGSGAFLNKATDILLNIHKTVHEVKYENNKSLDPYFDDIGSRRKIILNNIYGVDLNEESIEITKLSMFLKIAKKGLKLPNIDKNIIHGNSLIDNSNFTDNAFDWEKNYPAVFQNGGFDIVIGNPPYVRQEKIKELKPYLKEHYTTYTGVADLYVYFFEKGLNILKKDGYFGFICSNKFTRANYGKPLRSFLLNYNITNYNDYTGKKVFEGVTVDPSVIIINKTNPKTDILVNNDFILDQNKLVADYWSFVSMEILNLKDKIISKGTLIKEINGIKINYGIKTGLDEAFILNQETRDELIAKDPKNNEIIKPLLRGRDIHKWSINYQDIYLIVTKNGIDVLNEYPTIYEHLKQYQDKLTKRWDKGNYWYNLRNCAYYNDFEKPKIIYPNMAKSLYVYYDENNFYTNPKCFIITSNTIDLKYLGILLSSKVLNFVFKLIGSPLGTAGYDLHKQYIVQLPIIIATKEEQKPLINLAIEILDLNKKLLNEIKSFHNWLIRNYGIKINNKVNQYYELSFNEFIKEIKKQNKKLTRKNEDEIEKEYNQSIAIIQPLKTEIIAIDNKIDKVVYKLYELTEEEINIIEKSE